MKHYNGLTERQRLLVYLFFKKPGASLSALAREAGYCPGATDRTLHAFASKLVREPKVAREIARRQELTARRQGLTLERIVDEMAKLAFAEMPDYADLLNAEDPVAALKELPAELGAAIRSIKVTDIGGGKRRTEIDLVDKLKAQALLAGHLGLRRPLGVIPPTLDGGALTDRGERQATLRSMLGQLAPDEIAFLKRIAEKLQRLQALALEHDGGDGDAEGPNDDRARARALTKPPQ